MWPIWQKQNFNLQYMHGHCTVPSYTQKSFDSTWSTIYSIVTKCNIKHFGACTGNVSQTQASVASEWVRGHYLKVNQLQGVNDLKPCVTVLSLSPECHAVPGGLHQRGHHCGWAGGQLQLPLDHQPSQQEEPHGRAEQRRPLSSHHDLVHPEVPQTGGKNVSRPKTSTWVVLDYTSALL